MRHTIVIEVSDGIPSGWIETEVTSAIEALDRVQGHFVDLTVIEYHHEQMTGPPEDGTSFESDEEAGAPVFCDGPAHGGTGPDDPWPADHTLDDPWKE